MVDVDKAVVLKYNKKGCNFSIMIDPEKASEFRNGRVQLGEVLAAEEIFTDAKKGIRASGKDLMKVFGTNDKRKVAEIIIRDGNLPVTKKQKSSKLEEKRRMIVNIISKNAVDPKTGIPHPPQRIENAMNEARVRVDEFKNAEEQVAEITKKISPIIPIRFEVKKMQFVIPAKYSGLALGVIKREAKILTNEWNNDGSLKVIVEVPLSIEEKFFTDVNHACHGELESKEIK